ncbi:MAG: hypothetical protein K5656_09030 [Lachnospiraceae bacterium]|nr:hypothetical protein [Lachnospiraceae bacterium]
MRLARCEKGHYYDKDKFTECPHCNGMQIAPGETVAFEDPNKPKPAPEPVVPKVEVEERVAFSVTEAKNESSFVVEETPVVEEVASPASTPDNNAAEAEAGKPLDEMTTITLDEKPDVASSSSPQVEEVKAEPVEKEVKPAPVVEEVKPAPVVEEVKPAPVVEEVKPAPVVEEVKAEPVKEEVKAGSSDDVLVIEDETSMDDVKVEEEVSSSLKSDLDSANGLNDEEEQALDKNTNPVVGWLICIDGIHKGKSFDVKEGRNLVGRSMAMDVCLSGNSKIQRERHAILTYDPRSKTCFFQLEDSRELVYINDSLVLGPMKVEHEDVISMANEQFIYIKLSSDKIDWL